MPDVIAPLKLAVAAATLPLTLLQTLRETNERLEGLDRRIAKLDERGERLPCSSTA